VVSGLRARTAAALAFVSIITLVVTAFTLLAPLEQKLQADRFDSLVQAARDSRGLFEQLGRKGLVPGNPRLRRAARLLRRRSGGEIIVLGPTEQILTGGDPESRDGYPDGVAALRTGRVQRSVIDNGDERELAVALPVYVGRRPYALVLRRSLTDVRDSVSVVRRTFLLSAVISLAIAVLLSLVLTGRLVRRLRRLRDTVERVSRLGPEAEVQSDAARDEVGSLTRAFAEMQHNLRAQEHARRTFVATASHELRTPLSSLVIMLDLLRSDLEAEPVDVTDAKRQAERAERQAQRLSELAATLLDLSRIDAGVTVRRDVIELGEITNAVLDEFASRAAEGGRELRLEDAPARWALADPGSVAQILRIVVDNALRHTPEGTGVRLSLDGDDDAVELTVADEGPGVAEPDRARIFERFERGDSTSHGFGLGLAIGRELAGRMGGELTLVPDRHGGRFVLRLPAAPAL
jgi:signal transduction histidine kinase